MKCELCGYEFDYGTLSCHVSCPMADGCHIICCPNCGYQVVDTSRSSSVAFVLKVRDAWLRWRTPEENQA